VSKWFDTGHLKGFRIPGSRDRRIPLEELIRFMRAHEIPLSCLGGKPRTAVLYDTNGDHGRAVVQALARERIKLEVLDSVLAVGAYLAWNGPTALLIAVRGPTPELARDLRWLKSEAWTRSTTAVALVPAQEVSQRTGELRQLGFDHVLADTAAGELLAPLLEQEWTIQ